MRTSRKKKIILDCLDCGEQYSSKFDYEPCVRCGGNGEVSAANFKDANSDDEDDGILNLDNLAYDPSIFD